jgi:hypothetical protein
MTGSHSKKLTLAGLADRTGMSARRVRQLIESKVLPGAIGAGRGAHYSDQHVRLIESVKPYSDGGWSARDLAKLVPDLKAGAIPDAQHGKVSSFAGFSLATGITCFVDRSKLSLSFNEEEELRVQLQRHTGRFLRARGK